jgi:hypothetical protein
MGAPRWLENTLDYLGLLGFMVRDSARFEKMQRELGQRAWGAETAGFAVSIDAGPATARVGESIRLALAVRNSTGLEVRARIPAWLQFFDVDLKDAAGVQVDLSEFGKNVLSRPEPMRNVVFPPNVPVQAELPLNDLYRLNQPGVYRAAVECPVPAAGSTARCRSNELAITLTR